MDIFSIFFDIIFSPIKAFSEYRDLKPHKIPILFLFVVACSLCIARNDFTGFPSLISSFSFLLVGLLIYTSYIDVTAKMFNKESQFSRMFTLSAFALTPWIFISPIKMLSGDIAFLSVIGGFLTFGIYIWIIALQVLAISRAYDTPSKYATISLALPIFGFFIFIGSSVEFIKFLVGLFS